MTIDHQPLRRLIRRLTAGRQDLLDQREAVAEIPAAVTDCDLLLGHVERALSATGALAASLPLEPGQMQHLKEAAR